MPVLKSGRFRAKLTGRLAREKLVVKQWTRTPKKYRRLIDNPPEHYVDDIHLDDAAAETFEYLPRTENGEPVGPVRKAYGGPSIDHRMPAFQKDPNLGKRLCKAIAEGFPYTTVCNHLGIRIPTFLLWLERGRNGYAPEYVRLYRSVCRAEAVGEMNILRRLRRHAASDWRVSAWQLERLWPEKYGRVDRIRAETRSTIQITADTKKNLGAQVVQDDVARELARRMIDGEAQLHFNALPAPETKAGGNGHA